MVEPSDSSSMIQEEPHFHGWTVKAT